MSRNITFNKMNFLNLSALFIAMSLFVVGRFGFFDILGLKRFMEILLFIPIAIIGILVILRFPRVFTQPIFLLSLSFFVFQLLMQPNILDLADMSLATLIVGTILSLKEFYADLILRYTIKIATLFALLGLIEFFILLIEPSLVNSILLFYTTYSGSPVPVIENMMQLLGLSDGTSYHLWGMAVTRLRSFASEPSLLVGYFLVPGALSLTYEGKYYIYGLICIAFAMCSLSGSVYVSLAFAMFCIIFMLFRMQRTLVIFPFIIYLVFIWLLYTHFNDFILLSKSDGQSYDFFDKTNSANIRFSYIRDYIPQVLTTPFGTTEIITQPLGYIIRAIASSGFIGGVLSTIIILNFFKNLGKLIMSNALGFRKKVGLLIIYGSLIAGLLYLDNCFIQIYGFTLMTLIWMRLQKLQGIRLQLQSKREALFTQKNVEYEPC